MSILTQLLGHKITFKEAAAKIEADAAKAAPVIAATSPALVSDLKQAASNAVAEADTYLGAAIGPASSVVETALETALGGLTHGLSTPFNPLVHDAITKLAEAVKAQVDAWALDARARLSANATPNAPAPTPAAH
jgi:hypothetical protein